MSTTVPLPERELPARTKDFPTATEAFFHVELARGRYLPMSVQLTTGEMLRVRLTSAQVAILLGQLSALGIRSPEE